MPRHRSLSLRKFIKAVGPSLVEEYFVSRVPQDQLIPYFAGMGMTYEYVKDLLAGMTDEQLKGKIGEELRRIKGIGEQAMNILVRVTKSHDIQIDQNETPQQIAMRIFLSNRDAFQHAWALYCYHKSESKVYEYCLACDDFKVGRSDLQAFAGEVKAFFIDQAKGVQCIVNHYEEADESVIMVTHGSFIKTVARWVADEVVIDSYRPAYEDVLLYDKQRSVLQIKASVRKDREQYLKSLGNCILRIPELPEIAQNNVYDLHPLQDGTFSWEGNEKITQIIPVEAHLKITGSTESTLIMKSVDVRKAFQEDFDELDFSSGELTYVRFRITVETDDGPETITFEIEPPGVSDLSRKKHCEIISAYLKENGVQSA